MFNLLPVKGFQYSWKTKQQINSLNTILKAINRCAIEKPDKLMSLYEKLVLLHIKTIRAGKAKPPITAWFAAHPLFHIEKTIQLIIKEKQIQSSITELSQQIDLPAIYRRYEGKDSFRTLVQGQLNAINDAYEVINLGGNNNPIIQIKLDKDHSFVMRLLRVNSEEDLNYTSPRHVRDLLDDVAEVPKPYLLLPVEDDSLETTYIECGPYYERGSLEHLFKSLHAKNNKNGPDVTLLTILYAQKMIQLLIELNNHDVWYTDLKPGNILLTDNEHIAISDIKGLVLSPNKKISRNRVSLTPAYFQSSVFDKKEVNLERLQRQTLASTLYELLCNKLPTPAITHQPDWKNEYDFTQPCFKSPEGKFLKKFIRELSKSKANSLNNFLVLIFDFEDQQIKSYMMKRENEPGVTLDDSEFLSGWEI